jgi:vacuolar-type H+-ATPase subunit C/Vma6
MEYNINELLKGLDSIYYEKLEKVLPLQMTNKSKFDKYIREEIGHDAIKGFAERFNLTYYNQTIAP